MVGGEDRDRRIKQAEERFENELNRAGESICISSLPLLVDEVAAAAAGEDEELAAEIEARLRRRAGLHSGG
ncbi:MAG TPA: hypothetical protein VH459_09455 [Gaiellales bacterium]